MPLVVCVCEQCTAEIQYSGLCMCMPMCLYGGLQRCCVKTVGGGECRCCLYIHSKPTKLNGSIAHLETQTYVH